LLLLVLLVASARPQGRFKPLDPSQFQASLARATADLQGYELLGSGRARIDIDRAMELVAERGVKDLKLSTGGAPAAQAGAPAAPAAAQPAAVDGATVYQKNCQACHQATGQGIPSAFPPLAGHLPAVAAADRTLPPKAVLFGMTGSITVNGQAFSGVMPSWKQLGDAEIAAVLNHELTSWGNQDARPADFQPYTADDIAPLRDLGLSATDVYQQRQAAGLP